MAVHKDSLWKRGTRQPGNGLLVRHLVQHRTTKLYLTFLKAVEFVWLVEKLTKLLVVFQLHRDVIGYED